MYHWVKDKVFLKRSYCFCADLVNQLVQHLKSYDVVSQMKIVGSNSRNMVTQNEDGKIDFDFNLIIEDAESYNEHDLKELIRNAFNEVLKKNGLCDCEDSTSALTTKPIHFTKGNKTEFSIDVCLVKKDAYGLHRLIHQKSGIVQFDLYYWNIVPNASNLREKESFLKPDYWAEVRDTYLNKKNMYLQRPWDHDHPSFICYIEAVNEVYYRVKQRMLF